MGLVFEAPHDDTEAWAVMIYDAFGTRSRSAAQVFLRQIVELCRHDWHGGEATEPDGVELNAMLSVIHGVKPKSEIEAMLAAQMCGLHMMQMRMTGSALSGSGDRVDPGKAALSAKLARTFAYQIDALAKLKGRSGKQRITVRYERHDHKHVHFDGEGCEKKAIQAHAPKRHRDAEPQCLESVEYECLPALYGAHAEREALPGGDSEGEG